MYSEFDWISRECPYLLSIFKYWVDVQEIVQERCGLRPSLLKTVGAMNIIDRPNMSSTPKGHRASNDAVRTLAVLSGLISLESSHCTPSTETIRFSRIPRKGGIYPFAARITTADYDKLPACIRTPRALSTHFASYNPTAVGINSKAAQLKGVRVWWISLPTLASLNKFAADIDGSILEGKQLAVKKLTHKSPTEQSAQRIKMKIAERDEDTDDNHVFTGNMFDEPDLTVS
jgi:hypothetical protein